MMNKTTFSKCLDKTNQIERKFLTSNLYNKFFSSKSFNQINLLAFIALCLPACCILNCALIVASVVDVIISLFSRIKKALR